MKIPFKVDLTGKTAIVTGGSGEDVIIRLH